MKSSYQLFTIALVALSCSQQPATERTVFDSAAAEASINSAIAEWDQAWEEKNLELALTYYADDCDWTNAFGDRVQSKEELEKLLGFIFNLDFVMSGKNNYGENEITFLSDEIATVRSKNVRTDQEWPDGIKMGDRIVNHLRIFELRDGKWLITRHMISQAWPKQNG